jgi:hypothetical protein
MEITEQSCRFFVSYAGKKLPFHLIDPIAETALANRNTYIRAYYAASGRLSGFDKLVYGEVELSHRYRYDDRGVLRWAEIAMLDEDAVVLHFDESGAEIARDMTP